MKTEPLMSDELRFNTADPYLKRVVSAFDSWEKRSTEQQKNSKADWKDLKIAITNARAFIDEVLDKNKNHDI